MAKLYRKVALVTGGASGLGRAIAERLATDGASVVITDVQSSLGQKVAAESGFTFIEQDVTDEMQWGDVIQEVQERHGGLHILVNNAGILGSMDAKNPQNTRLTDWRSVFAVNVEGVFLGCRAAMPAMCTSGGGSIINMSSVAGLLATPYNAAYGASKAAVRQLTKSVAQHCAQERMNIRCNSVHPGNVRAPMWEKQAAEKARRRGVSLEVLLRENELLTPLGGETHAEDIASAVAFLASDESRRMTGAKLIVDGGSIHCDTYQLMCRLQELQRAHAR